MDNTDPYNVFLAIVTNIPVLRMTAFVLQGHISIKSDTIQLKVHRKTKHENTKHTLKCDRNI